jgi:hypothetical protein
MLVILCFQIIQIYRFLALCLGMVPKYGNIPMFTRLTPNFIGKEWFGSVSIQSENDVESIYYGQLCLLFRCNMVGEQDETIVKEFCLVRLYENVQFNMLLKCPKLKWQGNGSESYIVVEIALT